MIRKYKDWRGWWDGLRSKAVKAGAESVATSLSAMLGTNAVAGMGIPALADIGLNWKEALATMATQFALRTGFAAVQYVQTKPDPDLLEETVETTMITKEKKNE